MESNNSQGDPTPVLESKPGLSTWKTNRPRLLATAATLERGYQAFVASGSLPAFQPQVHEMDKLHRQWLVDLDGFKSALHAQGAEPKTLAYVDDAFGRLAERIRTLAASSSG